MFKRMRQQALPWCITGNFKTDVATDLNSRSKVEINVVRKRIENKMIVGGTVTICVWITQKMIKRNTGGKGEPYRLVVVLAWKYFLCYVLFY